MGHTHGWIRVTGFGETGYRSATVMPVFRCNCARWASLKPKGIVPFTDPDSVANLERRYQENLFKRAIGGSREEAPTGK